MRSKRDHSASSVRVACAILGEAVQKVDGDVSLFDGAGAEHVGLPRLLRAPGIIPRGSVVDENAAPELAAADVANAGEPNVVAVVSIQRLKPGVSRR